MNERAISTPAASWRVTPIAVLAAALAASAPAWSTCPRPEAPVVLMSALATTAAGEMRRWESSRDLAVANDASGQKLVLTATGKARCADGRCVRTQALLDLQSAPIASIRLQGATDLSPAQWRSYLVGAWVAQRNCDMRGGTTSSSCVQETHAVTTMAVKPDACGTVFHYAVTTSTGTLLDYPASLPNKLMFAGSPNNPFLAFAAAPAVEVRTLVPQGLVDDLQAGNACTAACLRVSPTSLHGACCSCRGVVGAFVKASWNASTYQCQ